MTMDNFMKLLLVQAIGTRILIETTALECTEQDRLVCVSQRDQYFSSLNYTSVYPIYQLSDEHLRDYCDIFKNQVKACYRLLRANCVERLKARFIGIEESWDYLCEETFEEYLEVKHCLQQGHVMEEVKICSHQFNQKVEIINEFTVTAADEYCEAVEDLIDCEADAMAVTCSREAERWAREYNSRLYMPELQVLGCSETPTTETPGTSFPTWIIAAAIGGFLVFFLVIVVIVVCCYRQHSTPEQHNDRGQDRRMEQHNPAGIPNPYVTNTGNQMAFNGGYPDAFDSPAWTDVRQNVPKSKHNKRKKNRKEGNRANDVPQEYLTPASSFRDNSVHYHTDPTAGSQSIIRPPSYKENDYYNPASPPPSYTSDPPTVYEPLRQPPPSGPQIHQYENNAYEEPVMATPRSHQQPRNNVYEELPDITGKPTPKKK